MKIDIDLTEFEVDGQSIVALINDIIREEIGRAVRKEAKSAVESIDFSNVRKMAKEAALKTLK